MISPARCLLSFAGRCLFLAMLAGTTLVPIAAEGGKVFASPEDAAEALVAAAATRNTDALRVIFGPASVELQNPDRVQAAMDLDDFVGAYRQTHRIVRESETKCVLEIGYGFWPFAVPIAKAADGWSFDAEAGKSELLNRRIGRNERLTIRSMRAYVTAQREYAAKDRDGDEVLEYAQKIRSTPGLKDGLYWPNLDGEASPLGPLAAQAQLDGYRVSERSGSEPFHGYYFKILTRQDKSAPGGKHHYVVNGNMIGGFALVAWPAEHGETGIMTFIVNQQGRVYQKDLGAKTGRVAAAMKEYDPDSTWVIAQD